MKSEQLGIGMTSQRARNRLVAKLREMGIRSETVLELIRTVPRHLFVDEALSSRAYENTALPIGHGQTISQPFVVAQMTEVLLTTGPLQSVLEIGAGCGYQSAILARLVSKVYAIERLATLANKLRSRLHKLDLGNVRVRHGDGRLGWPEMAPFDAILVAAASVDIPQSLLSQLNIGGRLVIPVGAVGAQDLMLLTRTSEGFTEERLDRVSFVPLLEGTG
ncbi:MAG: protein-L-isoaspartate(D-aspartate) O-methyltransferase [Gammaproteobacteria bacterium]|nr:protein-L-isoaspartate(D-aspartate) O-methyltransferase [Gammaproteobacteria bacterium]